MKPRALLQTDQRFAPVMRFVDWASLRHQLWWAYEGPVAEEARRGSYTDPDTSCWLVKKGSVTVRTGRHAVTARAGEWVFVASPTRHQTFTDDAEILSLHFELSWPGGESVVDRTRSRVVPAARLPHLEKAARPVVRALRRAFPMAGAYLPEQPCDRALYLRLQALLPEWLNAYLDAQEALGVPVRLRGERDERVLRGLAELDRMPPDRRVERAELAARLGLSGSHLDALFVAHTGMTLRRYGERRRLDTAVRLLRSTDKSVKVVAFELGFRHVSHFCLWFKRLKGVRPSELRGAR